MSFILTSITLILSSYSSPCSLGAWMGSITATGSVIAYGKLSGGLSSTALALPGRDYINAGLVSVCSFYILYAANVWCAFHCG